MNKVVICFLLFFVLLPASFVMAAKENPAAAVVNRKQDKSAIENKSLVVEVARPIQGTIEVKQSTIEKCASILIPILNFIFVIFISFRDFFLRKADKQTDVKINWGNHIFFQIGIPQIEKIFVDINDYAKSYESQLTPKMPVCDLELLQRETIGKFKASKQEFVRSFLNNVEVVSKDAYTEIYELLTNLEDKTIDAFSGYKIDSASFNDTILPVKTDILRIVYSHHLKMVD